jgi:alpha-galactosidase
MQSRINDEAASPGDERWRAPVMDNLDAIPKGDMPGDRIHISPELAEKAKIAFPPILEAVRAACVKNPYARAVVSVFGCSGSGKSVMASLFAYYINDAGIGTRIVSGDNYPRRIPQDNDRERLIRFREAGLKGLVAAKEYDGERGAILRHLCQAGADADSRLRAEFPWMAEYQEAGKTALAKYLGTPQEIDFDELSAILAAFRAGEKALTLKRMGREDNEIWYDTVDATDTSVLILEWTHGNSAFLRGVDVPVLLAAVPEETVEHRRARNRDGGSDSPFTAMVLTIEQALLDENAERAALVVGKDGRIMSKESWRAFRRAAGDSL